ncbi:ChaN family lipoprotein [Thiosulfativibrio zosterae]|uniref:PDZ domain-containing protein n=1 Tax=Thiosulfativibrio zosterae TaxID=2675053 RepID=A0A6F8PM48_9GAMM|nr:ChaN family lipoprotein [Thiosulfativibrio zosterae]BBP43183.1 hypothetical protein THMIRHAT_09290 [Thiosulfativibrio zosterae]
MNSMRQRLLRFFVLFNVVVGGIGMQAVVADEHNVGFEVTRAGQQMAFSAFLADLKTAKVAIVGEYHDSVAAHELQLKVLQGLQTLEPQQWALGIEWLPVSAQAAIDDYLADKTDDFQFLQASDYVNRWGFDARLVLPILRYAKEHNIKVLALNAPSELTRQVSKEGLDSLSAEQRALFPNPLLPQSPQYLEFLEDFLKNNHIPADKKEMMLTVQAIWDQTMAMSVINFLKHSPSQKVLVLAGMVHAAKGQGIQDALQHLNPQMSIKTIGNGSLENEEDFPFDYFVHLPEMNLSPALVLGVMLQTDHQKLTVEEVNAEGLAIKLGLQKGDQIQQIGDYLTNTLADLKLALWLSTGQNQVVIKWLRHDDILDIDLPYQALWVD